MSISYKYATVAQIADHFATSHRSSVYEAIKYYKDNPLVLSKIMEAKVLVAASKKQNSQQGTHNESA